MHVDELSGSDLLLLLIAGGGFLYFAYKNSWEAKLSQWLQNFESSVASQVQNTVNWPAPGQQGQNIGGQTVGTSTIGTQYNINSNGWTVFPPDGSNPIVNLDPNSDPVGPAGQSISQLQAAGWTNQQIADEIGMSWQPGGAVGGSTSTPVGGASGSY
jgi:hypothetical protein